MGTWRGNTKVVSDRLNCAASACISASVMPCAFSNTQRVAAKGGGIGFDEDVDELVAEAA